MSKFEKVRKNCNHTSAHKDNHWAVCEFAHLWKFGIHYKICWRCQI